MSWRVEFFEDEHGRQPAREWIQSLDATKRATVIAAIETYLTDMGQDVCRTEHGKHLGKGLFEFRVRTADILLRVFCHAYGDRIVLLLGGYDKGSDPKQKRQNREIGTARKRLRSFQLRLARQRTGRRRRR